MNRTTKVVACSFLLAACSESPTATPDAAAPASASAPASAAAADPSASATAATTAASTGAPAAPATPAADPSKLQIEGKAIQGGLMKAKLTGKVKKAEFPGHWLVVAGSGEFLIAFGRNAPAKDTVKLWLDDGTLLERTFDVEQRTYEKDVVKGLTDDMISPDPKEMKKLAEEEAKIEKVRKHFTEDNCYKDGFIWPTKGKISSRYGQPRVLNDKEGGIHWGVDIAAAVGTKVVAPACGKVVLVEKDIPLSGNTIIIDHGQGLTSTFLHLNSFAVKVGDAVKQGQPIGTVGVTGRANGPHLDWRANHFETRIDVELLAPPMP